MGGRSIAQYTRAEFDVLRARLEGARDTLRSGGRLLQSVARGYYVVYALASFLGGKYGVRATHVRGRDRVTDQNFSHYELPALLHALYTGLKKETITDPGSSPGIGSGHYDEHSAFRNSVILVGMRIEADYGPSTYFEPYSAAETDALLEIAQNLIQDLETIL